jgi:hypothetical protein
MRFHAFGSLCDFLMASCSVLLDNCLMRFDVFFAVMRFPAEISCLFGPYKIFLMISRGDLRKRFV